MVSHISFVVAFVALTLVLEPRAQSGQVTQTPSVEGRQVETAASISVESVTQFDPTVWKMAIQVPTGTGGVLLARPAIECDRLENGTWGPAYGEPGSRIQEEGPPISPPPGVDPRLHVRLEGEQTTTFAWELSDWRVVGYAGQYRARVRWFLGDEHQVRFTDWAQFTVSAADATGVAAPLLAAQANRDAVWAAYKQFMNEPIELFVPGTLGSGSAVAQAIIGGMQAKMQAPAATLTALNSLPAGLKRRLDMKALITNARTAWAGAPGPGRTQAIRQWIDDLNTFATGPDVHGALAKWQALVLTKMHEGSTAFTAASAEFASNPVLMAVGIGMPDVARNCGLLAPIPRPSIK